MKNVKTFEDFIGENKEVNEKLNKAQIEKIVLNHWDELERFINDSILDSVFLRDPDADIELIRKSTVSMVNEIIDIWIQTVGDEM